ncbi:MAG: hypothetical protein RI601_01965 [Desulfurivibrionaceae bacterium]|nr:hypothetical protein [Desulfurivibrionaceae bacterium]
MATKEPYSYTADDLFEQLIGRLKVDQAEQNNMDLGKNECGASHYGKVGVSAEAQRQKQ